MSKLILHHVMTQTLVTLCQELDISWEQLSGDRVVFTGARLRELLRAYWPEHCTDLARLIETE